MSVIKISFLIQIFLGLASLAQADSMVSISSCQTNDRKPTESEILQFKSETKPSGVVLIDHHVDAELAAIEGSSLSATEMIKLLSGREFADLRNAKLIFIKEVGHWLCGVFRGEVVYRTLISLDLLPTPDPQPVPKSALTKERFFIPVLTAGILNDSVWSERHVLQRLAKVKDTFAQCGLEIDKLEIRYIENSNNQFDNLEDDLDLRDSKNVLTPFEIKLGNLIGSSRIQPPAILYLNNFRDLSRDAADCWPTARAFVKEKIVGKRSPIGGVAVLSDEYSPDSRVKKNCGPRLPRENVDAHELGHLLLQTGGHKAQVLNLMGFHDGSQLSDEQCALIRGSPFVHRVLR